MIAVADDQRAAAAGADDRLGRIDVYDAERIAAGDVGERAARRRLEIVGAAIEFTVNQVGENLGVGLRAKLAPSPCSVWRRSR